MIRYIVGIDEAGRGPLAGPVSVAAVAIPIRQYHVLVRYFSDAKDSKKLSPKQRESLMMKIKKRSRSLSFSVSLVGNALIDRRGIVWAIRTAIKRCLIKLNVPPDGSRVLLDGSLKAPEKFSDQKTIIRGDDTVKIISLASIVAKVHRDRHIMRMAKRFPEYGFEIHKGYGTRHHLKMLRKHGPSAIHRRSFLTHLPKR